MNAPATEGNVRHHLRPAASGWWLAALCAALALLSGGVRAADRTPFDHLTTGFELLGQHRDLPCESCHVNAIFKGTPRDCSACHGVGTAVRATAKPVSHILTSNNCEACHTPVAWNPAVNFDHAEVRGSCSSCHNGVQAQGKGPTHIETDLECNLCHTTIGWAGAVFNHTNVTSGCSNCHNGIGATGPPATHIPTGAAANPADPANAPCEACHSPTNYITWSGTAMNHPAVTPPMLCANCHEKGMSFFGVTIVTRPDTVRGVVHPATGDCGQCHQSTVSFATGNLQPVGHIPTSQPCTLCHLVPGDFTTKIMDHTGIANGCATCHADGSSFTNMAPLVLVMPNSPKSGHVAFGGAACESCHSNTTFTSPGGFQIQNMSGAAPPAMVHAAVTATPCATCHGAGKTDFGTMPKTTVTISSVNHIPIGSATCDSCHSKTDFSTFVIPNASTTAAPGMVHTAVTSTACSTCHERNLTWVGTAPTTVVTRPLLEASGATHPTSGECSDCHKSTTSFKGASNYPANHIALLAGTSANCSTCHTNANDYSVFVMSTPGHALVGSVCASCHATGLTFANMPPKILTHPSANHIPFGAAACDSCHSPTAFDSFVFSNASGTAPPAMVHTAVAATACSTCHEKGKTDSGTPPTVTRPLTEPHQTGNPPHPVSGECSDCHKSTSTFIGATNYPANHIPLTAGQSALCATCHTNGGDFGSYVMGSAGHALVSSACATCHATGKSFANMAAPTLVMPPGTHVPFGSAACESCHSGSTFTQPGGFKIPNSSATAPPGMVHTAVAGTACITCHGAGKTDYGTAPKATVTISSVNHIPTGAIACEGCHSSSSFTSFSFTNASGTAPPAMVHSVVTSIVCSTCHEAGKSWVGSPAIKVRPALKADGTPHVASGECSTCHFSTTSFLGATDLPANHLPIPPADGANCVLCHTTVGNLSLAVMNHVNITTNCMQCHASGLSFANMAPPTLVQPPSGPTGHIPTNPPNGTVNFACELCHLPTVFTSFAGTIMNHATVRAMTCMSCHERGMTWKTNTGKKLWVRPNGHHTGQDCGNSGCHNARDKLAVRRSVALSSTQKSGTTGTPTLGTAAAVGHAVGFDHRRVAGTACVSCHGPGSGIGKPASHIATTDSCESCHMTLAWLPVTRVDHLQVRGACATCHNGTVASGKGSNHIVSGSDCETCHTSNAWTPARFDHAGVAPHTCRTCHDGIHASGVPVNHVPTTAQCDTCHGTLSWKPAKLDHTTLTAPCASCHNNSVALGVSPTHMVMTRDCATCHSYPDWSVLHFVHASAAYPGEHRAALVCASCHTTNTDRIPWPSAAQAGSCAGCHAKDFKPDLHPKSMDGLKYTAMELRDCTGACHVYSDATLGKIAKPMPGPYHRVSDAAFKH